MKFAATSVIVTALSSTVLAAPLPGPAPRTYSGTSTYDVTGFTMRKHKDKIQSVSFTLSINGKSVADCNEPQFVEDRLTFCLLAGGSSGYFFRIKDNQLMINPGFGNEVPNTAKVALSGVECHVNGGEVSNRDTDTKVSWCIHLRSASVPEFKY